VGRIRYLGVLLYDADRIPEVAARPDRELVLAQREMILDPTAPEVAAAARAGGVAEPILEAARRSPVYRFVKEWGLALPLHPEFRTLPMLFYVPPVLPAIAATADGDGAFFSRLESARLPLRYLAGLFGGGDEGVVAAAYRRLLAVRVRRRAEQVGDLPAGAADEALAAAGLTPAQADAIHRLTALADLSERVVVPALAREGDTEPAVEPQRQNAAGLGFLTTLGGR
jgi:nitrate reductase beta subunit